MRSRKVTDAERLDNLKTLLALCEFNEKHMKSVNDYYHENGTVQGCPGVTPDAAEIIDKGIAAGEYPDGQPFSTHDVLHEYYEAQRLRPPWYGAISGKSCLICSFWWAASRWPTVLCGK